MIKMLNIFSSEDDVAVVFSPSFSLHSAGCIVISLIFSLDRKRWSHKALLTFNFVSFFFSLDFLLLYAVAPLKPVLFFVPGFVLFDILSLGVYMMNSFGKLKEFIILLLQLLLELL